MLTDVDGMLRIETDIRNTLGTPSDLRKLGARAWMLRLLTAVSYFTRGEPGRTPWSTPVAAKVESYRNTSTSVTPTGTSIASQPPPPNPAARQRWTTKNQRVGEGAEL